MERTRTSKVRVMKLVVRLFLFIATVTLDDVVHHNVYCDPRDCEQHDYPLLIVCDCPRNQSDGAPWPRYMIQKRIHGYVLYHISGPGGVQELIFGVLEPPKQVLSMAVLGGWH